MKKFFRFLIVLIIIVGGCAGYFFLANNKMMVSVLKADKDALLTTLNNSIKKVHGYGNGEMAAGIIGKEDFLEIYVSTPLEECERRDVKGLYAKARRGEIKNFTGISAPFEAPAHPALSLDTSKLSLKESVDQLLDLILPKVIKK